MKNRGPFQKRFTQKYPNLELSIELIECKNKEIQLVNEWLIHHFAKISKSNEDTRHGEYAEGSREQKKSWVKDGLSSRVFLYNNVDIIQ